MSKALRSSLILGLLFCAAVLRAQPPMPEGAVLKKTTLTGEPHQGQVQKMTLVQFFDAEGRVLRDAVYAGHEPVDWTDITYDSHGNRASMEVWRKQKKERLVRYTNTYDAQGRLIEVRPSVGVPVRKIAYHSKGRLEMEYNGGALYRRISYDDEGRVTGEYNKGVNIGTMYSYDDHGELIEMRTNYEEGHEIWRYRNVYDDQGRLKERYWDGTLEFRRIYNEEGLLIREIRYDRGGVVMSDLRYSYTRL